MKEVKDKLHVKGLSKDMAQEVMIDGGVSWFNSILDELQEDLDATEIGLGSDKQGIWFKGVFTRRSNGKFGEVLFVEGELSAHFYTNCIKTGRLMMDEIEAQVKAVFVDEEMITRYALEEEIDIELEGEEFDLYHYKDDVADMGAMLHEYVFLNRNPYPTLEPESEES